MTVPQPPSWRVVVSDHAFPNLDVERNVLTTAGAVLDEAAATHDADWRAQLATADALLVQWATIDAEVVSALTNCKLIVRYGIGLDNVDVGEATARGIRVSNVPDYGLDEVADHASALVLAGMRRLPQLHAHTLQGRWSDTPERPLRALDVATLGLAGFGGIGRRVARRLQAFGMSIVAFDPFVSDDVLAEAAVERVDFAGLLSRSDAISVHLPLTASTSRIFDADAFTAMREGSVFVNTSRGGVVDEAALLAALDAGSVAFAGLDVVASEPPANDAPLLRHPRALVTGHNAWYSEQSLARLHQHAAEEVVRAMRGEPLRYCVNP